MTDTQFNYVTANRFYVQMQDKLTASFSECSGLGVKLQYEKQIEGGVNDFQRVVLGEPDFSEVTLKRGITDDTGFWTWMNDVLNSEKQKRRNVSILLFNQAGEVMQTWTLIGAIPVGWKVDSLQASSDSVALEELTLAYEGMKIEKGQSGGFQDLSSGREASSQIYPGRS
jgi:phage tail-like protein